MGRYRPTYKIHRYYHYYYVCVCADGSEGNCIGGGGVKPQIYQYLIFHRLSVCPFQPHNKYHNFGLLSGARTVFSKLKLLELECV